MKLIVGLGNPGLKYKYTRHNVGFMAVDFLMEKFGSTTSWKKHKSGYLEYAKLNINGQKYEFIKPLTFMNKSGVAVEFQATKSKVSNVEIYVVYDELDLPFGKLRLRNSGSSAGHNGIKSIIRELGTEKFNRIRIGIRNENPEKASADKFVLSKFSKIERGVLKTEIFLEIEKIIFNQSAAI